MTQIASPTMPKCQNLCASYQRARQDNKEKSYRYFLEKLALGKWLQITPVVSELRAEPPPDRLWSYVNLHLRSPLCRHLFQPSPYLRAQVTYQLKLLRLRTQVWLDHIPTHMHHCRSGHRPSYSQRHCTLCTGCILGDETHMITECPQLNSIFHQHTHPFRVLFRLSDLTSFDGLNPEDRLRTMLGNPAPGMLMKNMSVWVTEVPVRCGLFVYDLQDHISTHAPFLTVLPFVLGGLCCLLVTLVTLVSHS